MTGSIDYHHGMLKIANLLPVLGLLLCAACTTMGTAVDEAEPVLVEESAPLGSPETPEAADAPDAPDATGRRLSGVRAGRGIVVGDRPEVHIL